jgi:hypothetical protein
MTTEEGRLHGRQTLHRLTEETPSAHPARVIFCKLSEDCWAETYIMDEGENTARFIIRIQREMDDDFVKGTIAHEYAHCLSWYWEDADHGPAFGLAFSKVWSLLFDEGV